jgi:hypothetical protein
MTAEKYLPTKMLVDELAAIGVVVSNRYLYAAMRAGLPNIRNCAKLSVVIAWLEAHPNFVARPRACAAVR